jgi:DNA invertase Pin-like site-specific DNA recombinase
VRQRIVALYQAGKKWQEIATETGVSSFTVGNVLRAEGVAADRGQLTRTSPEDEAKILAMYADGVPLTQIVRETGRTEHTITAVLRRNGTAPSRKPHRLNEDVRERIPGLYASGMDAPEIGRLLGCHSSSVYNVLEQEGIGRREQIACDNPGYFDQIDTPDKAYWLGFLGADGCVTGFTRGTKTYLRLQVKLARKDRDHLVTLHKALRARRPIRDYDEESFGKMVPVSMLAVSSQQVADALMSHGIVRKKTDVLEPWDGPADLMSHYWRGLIDGDGSITINERGVFVQLLGSELVAKAYAAWVNTLIGSKVNATRKKDSKAAWCVQVGGTVRVLRLIAALYDDAPVALARKKALADLAVHGKPFNPTLF